ncbi:MAG: serine/threonine-protein phosphatase [Cytophagaceae bacterium]|jgi:hypothetical protein|nr:serine/threonine-protein phosphatase [Cytophagaceae bacterium]
MSLDNNIFIDVSCYQTNHSGEIVCGDVFVSRRIKEEGRTIAVLSDGMGSGIKANVLASLTASMSLNFTLEHREALKTSEIIMNTLPVCSERGTSYSTFTIVDVEDDGETSIVEFENPVTIVMRGTEIINPGWEKIKIEEGKYEGKKLRTCKFSAQKEDRIIFCSDGVIQAGMGGKLFPAGWGFDEFREFVLKSVRGNPIISAAKLSREVVGMANRLDGEKPVDDTSCAVIYYRLPRKLLFVSGPPFDDDSDAVLAAKVRDFEGKKIISGGTTTEIIARELNLSIETGIAKPETGLPPVSYIKGIDLVTEGVMTLDRVLKILETSKTIPKTGIGPADEIVKLFMTSDEIQFIVGTRINIAHQDPNLPVELEIRRSVIKRIATILEDKFLKAVMLEYI